MDRETINNNLDILCSLDENQKLGFYNDTFSIINNNILGSIYRTYTGDNRNDTIKNLKNLINITFEYLKANDDTDIFNKYERLNHYLNILANTYREDINTHVKIKNIIKKNNENLLVIKSSKK